MTTPCKGQILRSLPFAPLGSLRSRRARPAPVAHAKSSPKTFLQGSVGAFMLQAPAWADELVAEAPKYDLPSRLPSPEEVTST